MILVDTSAWIEYDQATGSAVHRELRRLIADSAAVAVTQPVVMELMIGARSPAHREQLARLMARFALLPFDAGADFDAAAQIYTRSRGRGITPRGMIDCMIAAVAWRTGAALLAQDVDLTRIAGALGIPVVGTDSGGAT